MVVICMFSFIISGLLLQSDLAGGNSFGDILMVLDPMWQGSYKLTKFLASEIKIRDQDKLNNCPLLIFNVEN